MSNSIENIQIVADIALPSITEASPTVAEALTDLELIAVAKDLNALVHFHLRRSVEEFWKLGETLTRLSERPSVKGRWREVLKEIGINHTSANQAQRLFAATTLKKLAGYRNKTAALRALGILSEPTPVNKETPDRSSKATAKVAPAEPTFAEDALVGVPLTENPAEQRTTSPSPDLAGPSDEETSDGNKAKEITSVNKAKVRRPEPALAEMTLDPLTKITKIVASLEYLARDEFDLTAEFAAQVERAKKALDLLLGKGAFNAAV